MRRNTLNSAPHRMASPKNLLDVARKLFGETLELQFASDIVNLFKSKVATMFD